MNKLLKSSFEYYRKSIKWQLLIVGDSQKIRKKKQIKNITCLVQKRVLFFNDLLELLLFLNFVCFFYSTFAK